MAYVRGHIVIVEMCDEMKEDIESPRFMEAMKECYGDRKKRLFLAIDEKACTLELYTDGLRMLYPRRGELLQKAPTGAEIGAEEPEAS